MTFLYFPKIAHFNLFTNDWLVIFSLQFYTKESLSILFSSLVYMSVSNGFRQNCSFYLLALDFYNFIIFLFRVIFPFGGDFTAL